MLNTKDDSVQKEIEARQFLSRLKDDLTRLKVTCGLQRNSEALLHWAIHQISPSLSDKDIHHAMEVGGVGDKGIDAAWWDSEAQEEGRKVGAYFIAQAKCPDSLIDVESYGADPARELLSGYQWLTGSSPGKLKKPFQRVKTDVDERLSGGQRLRLAVIIGGVPTKALIDEVKMLGLTVSSQTRGLASAELFDLYRLNCLHLDRLEQGDLPPPEEARFKIRTTKIERTFGPRRALVGEVPALEIFNLVEQHGLALFSKNLRVPLARSRFNLGIRHTLEVGGGRENLWYYNNGITAVCTGFDYDKTEDSDDKVETVIASDLMIVNGCQTCDTIHQTIKEWREEDRSVPGISDAGIMIRLIELGPQSEGGRSTFGRDVARFTNSQNPITGRNLRANDPEQSNLREQLRGRGFFFETKPGEWERRIAQDPQYYKLFQRRDPVIDNEEAAQYSLAFWSGKPIMAKMQKRQIFEDDLIYHSVYSLDTRAEAVLMAWLLAVIEERWRRRVGFQKRAPKGKRRNRISRPLVYTHGNLVLLAMLGTGIQENSKPGIQSDAPRLGRACDVLTHLVEGSTVGAINLKDAEKAIHQSLDSLLTVLYTFCRAKLAQDPEGTVRNLLVRDATWADLRTASLAEITTATRSTKEMLLGREGTKGSPGRPVS